jgi:hypothetical protein
VRPPLVYFLLIAGAWLSSLGACGRTAPLLEDTYGNFAGEGNGTGGSRTGGTSGASSGGSSTGGSTTGGSSSGGSSNGGSAASPGTGGTGIDDGGATFTGGAGGNVAAGGTEPAGGAFSVGGTSPATGGSGNQTGGVGADGGTSGSSPMTGGTGGDTMMTGGTGGSAGTGGMMPLPPGFIRCGDTACDGETSICCQRRSSPSTCEDPSTNCMGATLTCSGASSCAGEQICCYHARESLCLESCEVSVGSPGNSPTIILCNSDDECDEGQTCVFAPRGIAYCGDDL